MSTADDKILVERVLAGDDGAIEAFLRRFEPRIFSFAYRLCGQRQDAEDLTQDTFVAALKGLKGFRWQASLSSWLYRIAVHRCQRIRRLRSGQPRSLLRLDAPLREGQAPLDPADPAPSAHEHLERQELRAKVQAAIRLLDKPYRLVIVLRDVEGLSNEEAAKALGLSVAAVKSRLHRARQMLKALVQP
jgi:RNA polymerase sigma-70 factor (ECF subfamily)